ncbi:uncharacterized protein LOC131237145 isoform X2 [Magnolia sinica]|uniref:uncharacterized protein LOC131237145 isoform X2 n=1 Tax=Magnolia sinica TaxID=86752 RepID=UPI00265A4474|nr:uncharacterized protein LOC131237145 isoform X2 [Magnolia sinica]
MLGRFIVRLIEEEIWEKSASIVHMCKIQEFFSLVLEAHVMDGDLLSWLIRKKMLKTAKEGIKQQDNNSEIYGKMQAVFIEMDKSPAAEVEGQKITWLTPHALRQVLTDDVDFNVMLTFLEFYEESLAEVS